MFNWIKSKKKIKEQESQKEEQIDLSSLFESNLVGENFDREYMSEYFIGPGDPEIRWRESSHILGSILNYVKSITKDEKKQKILIEAINKFSQDQESRIHQMYPEQGNFVAYTIGLLEGLAIQQQNVMDTMNGLIAEKAAKKDAAKQTCNRTFK